VYTSYVIKYDMLSTSSLYFFSPFASGARAKVGEDNLTRIIEEKAVRLLKRNGAKDVDAVFDASFIKAWSTRHPLDNQKGYSDGNARVGRAGRIFGLDYKLHLAIDSS
jgi:hypothetical protein